MKRNRGIPLLVGFLLLFAAYILWSAHPFFIGTKLKFQGSVPPEAKRVSEEWYNKRGEPESFSANAFAYLLTHPYQAGVSHYVVTRESSTSFSVNRSQYGAFWVVLEDGQWQVDRDSMVIY